MSPLSVCFRCNISNIGKWKRTSRALQKPSGTEKRELPKEVPPGHLAITLGGEGRRFVIKIDYLNHPVFRQLLDKAYQEYGHSNDGPLTLCCDELLFEDIIESLEHGKMIIK